MQAPYLFDFLRPNCSENSCISLEVIHMYQNDSWRVILTIHYVIGDILLNMNDVMGVVTYVLWAIIQ